MNVIKTCWILFEGVDMNDHTSSSNSSLRGARPNGAETEVHAIDPEMLEAMLVEATDTAPAVNDPSLALDEDLETCDLHAIGAAASGTRSKMRSDRTMGTSTEKSVHTCGGCRG
ncbi:hypothetical protein [Paraburkholderia youngii]|uniref:Uncharacterized protein n=1 Tax=Paraburkholderia youngii TaxID=2782701 RepID=A0ABX2NYW0_9BURK|nr:hypothetical protein [Paraburkholderia youngii]NVI09178.1 hypothetical protein [Paraburkholderia youngii]